MNAKIPTPYKIPVDEFKLTNADVELLKIIDEQKKQENELVNQRTTWGLTANNFLVISSAIAGRGTIGDTILFDYVIPVIGIVIAIAALMGVYAAKAQLEYLKGHWKRIANWNNPQMSDKQRSKIVRPFGNRRISEMGSYPTFIIFGMFGIGWLIFGISNIF